MEQKIMTMYAKGMISKITDRILPEVNEWQNRPLDSIDPIVFFDGIVFHLRKDGKIVMMKFKNF